MRGFASRVVLLAVLGVAILAAAGCDRSVRRRDTIYVEVHNRSLFDDVVVEVVDPSGFVVDIGIVDDGETVGFVIDDYYEGRALQARCLCDGSVVDVEIAYDGLHWDVF